MRTQRMVSSFGVDCTSSLHCLRKLESIIGFRLRNDHLKSDLTQFRNVSRIDSIDMRRRPADHWTMTS